MLSTKSQALLFVFIVNVLSTATWICDVTHNSAAKHNWLRAKTLGDSQLNHDENVSNRYIRTHPVYGDCERSSLICTMNNVTLPNPEAFDTFHFGVRAGDRSTMPVIASPPLRDQLAKPCRVYRTSSPGGQGAEVRACVREHSKSSSQVR